MKTVKLCLNPSLAIVVFIVVTDQLNVPRSNQEKIAVNLNFRNQRILLKMGNGLKHERQIIITYLLKPVGDAIKTKFPGWTITVADKTETAKHGLIYEEDIKKGKAKKEVAFKEDGISVIE